MSKTNMKATSFKTKMFLLDSTEERLAGGFGMRGAKQTPEALLRRAVMTCLLWEDLFYESGDSVAKNIADLIPKVNPETVYNIALEAKFDQKLRHVPLYIAVVMAGLNSHKHLVAKLLKEIIVRPDELTEVLAMYWKNGRKPVSAQIKKGLADAFNKFSEFQFSKYKGKKDAIKTKDVLKLTHPVPESQEKSAIFNKILTDTLPVPDTWETQLSAGMDKKSTWERLISERKLGALAFLRNLRNMLDVGVHKQLIRDGIESLNPKWLLPLNFLTASKVAPTFEPELESLMMKMLEGQEKMKGLTVFIVDVSGSMTISVSGKSQMSRLEVAEAMAMVASNLSEKYRVYATAGSDGRGVHDTKEVAPRKGFGLISEIQKTYNELGGGGIFTRQALEYVRKDLEGVIPDRIIVFSDSQDCDRVNKTPEPFGKENYIIDVSAHKHGVNYDGSKWTAEISGWSEKFVDFILAMEGVSLQETEE